MKIPHSPIRALRAVFTFSLLTFALSSISSAQSPNQDPDASVVPSATATPLCPIPSAPGIDVCSPGEQPETDGYLSPLQILASARGASGAVNHIEIWVDGKKISNVFSNQVNTLVTLPTGTRRVTLVEVDTSGAFIKSDPRFASIIASNGCAAPGAPGVHVCEPAACIANPRNLPIVATATPKSGTVNHMEVWVNGRKYSQFPGNQVSTNLDIPLTEFTRVVVVEVDSAGNVIDSAPVTEELC